MCEYFALGVDVLGLGCIMRTFAAAAARQVG